MRMKKSNEKDFNNKLSKKREIFIDANAENTKLRRFKFYENRESAEIRRGDRVVECARLEIECASKAYRGFESPPLRVKAFFKLRDPKDLAVFL